MPSVLTEEQQREYHENRFVVAHTMFSAASFDLLRRMMAEYEKAS